jgi:hypothetical protein
VSNQKCVKEDFDEWVRQCDKSHVPVITKDEAASLKQRLLIPGSYVYHEDDIRRMVEEKEKLRKMPTNVAIALQKLIEKKEVYCILKVRPSRGKRRRLKYS